MSEGRLLIGYSRALPWRHRPEATRLLEALAAPDHTFDAVVIGEPQRAFYGSQFSDTFPVLQHFGVDLWVPDVGSRIDPDSDIHELRMTIFGGISKGERRRIQRRVIGAMEAATVHQGRFLGGRPPYGYRIASVGPHPNPSKAADGINLHVLEPDPATAPAVQRVFDLYLSGTGLRAIATRLNQERLPCPSAHDPDRNTHRLKDGWQASTVRAILTNPCYLGHQVWGRWHRVERLLDPMDVAAGTVTVFRRSAAERIVTSTEPSHPALVSPEAFRRVQSLLASGSASAAERPHTVRSATSPYQLRGRLHCGLCGRRMSGHRRGPTLHYRCRAADLVPSKRPEHPRTVYLREDGLVETLDDWLHSVLAPDRLEATVRTLATNSEASLADDSRRQAITARIGDAQQRLAQFKEALTRGADPGMVSAWINEAQADLARARTDLALLNNAVPAELTRADLTTVLRDMSSLVSALSTAEPSTKPDIYRDLGLRMECHHDTGEVEAEISTAEACAKRGVRGGT
ncbi:recombinase family protein [Geodermatophilus ruber]|uniref:Recombinase zinc beta ribbon domain-containing protein n=1 Tax=Geodermatophilus ruber TaxID=504800 RepID=A0A1I4C3C1_9ACTN|nr:recombinase family protein [Geodermatophilus ruber]SFK74829.1 Recombinase zinc beta ribbon domain-containing protein [Geodermatophilus ruber]